MVEISDVTYRAQGAIFLRYFCMAITFGVPTSSRVAQACLLREERVARSNYLYG